MAPVYGLVVLAMFLILAESSIAEAEPADNNTSWQGYWLNLACQPVSMLGVPVVRAFALCIRGRSTSRWLTHPSVAAGRVEAPGDALNQSVSGT